MRRHSRRTVFFDAIILDLVDYLITYNALSLYFMSYAKAQRARKVGIFEHRQPDYGNREPAKMAVASPSKWAKPGSAHLSAMVTTHSSTRSVGIP